MVNKDRWAELPDDIQQIVHGVSAKYSEELWQSCWEADAEFQKICVENGMTVLSMDPAEREKLIAASAHMLWKTWVDDAGPDGVAMMRDMEKVLARNILDKIGY